VNAKIYFVPARRRWRLEYFQNGKRFRPTFKTKEKAEAGLSAVIAETKAAGTAWTSMPEAERADLMFVLSEIKKAGRTVRQVWEDHKRGNAGESLTSKTLGAAVTECVQSKLGANRRRIYVDKLEWLLLRFIKGRDAQDAASVTTADVEAFLAGKTAITRKTYTSHLAAFFSFCERRDYIRKNPCDRLERITIDRKPPQILTLKQCLTALTWTRNNDPQMLGWLVLALPCGLRPSEADRIPPEAVDVKRGIVTVDIGKVRGRFSSRRIVEMSASAKYWFRQAAKSSVKPQWQMPYDKRRFRLRKLRDALGFDRWPQDLLRHSYASYMLAARGDVGKVAKLLGNSVAVTLNHYQELVSKADGLRFQNLTSTAATCPA
jgi:site-specific recombinase XerD